MNYNFFIKAIQHKVAFMFIIHILLCNFLLDTKFYGQFKRHYDRPQRSIIEDNFYEQIIS